MRHLLLVAMFPLLACGAGPTPPAAELELEEINEEVEPVAHVEGCIGESMLFSGEASVTQNGSVLMVNTVTDEGRRVMIVLMPTTRGITGCEGPERGGWEFDRGADNVFMREDDNGFIEFRAEWLDQDGRVTDHVEGFVQR